MVNTKSIILLSYYYIIESLLFYSVTHSIKQYTEDLAFTARHKVGRIGYYNNIEIVTARTMEIRGLLSDRASN